MALQIFFIFVFIGIPSLLKMKWDNKKYLVAFALFQWYAIMWFRYLKYERSEKHLLQNKHGVKIVSQWDRKRSVYHPIISVGGNSVELCMRLDEDEIFDRDGQFSLQKFEARCKPVEKLVQKKTE